MSRLLPWRSLTAVAMSIAIVGTVTTALDVPRAGAAPTTLAWSHQLGTTPNDVSHAITTDDFGNVVVAGQTFSTLPGSTDTSAGSHDAFVAKYSSSGSRLWVRQLGTTSDDVARGVATDTAGNVYIAGYTSLAMPGETAAGGVDGFVAKYSPSGTRLWVRQLGSTSYDELDAIAVDAAGNVYVGGYTRGTVAGSPELIAGLADAFAAKYSTAGTKLWVHQIGSTVDDTGHGIAVDTNGNVYLSGSTNGTLPTSVESTAGSGDAFLVKYSTTGARTWVHQLGSTAFENAYAVAVDANGNPYIAGYTNGTLPGSPDPGVGSNSMFAARFSAAGARVWVRQLGVAAKTTVARGIAVDALGNVHVAGETTAGLPGALEPAAGLLDAFAVQLTSAGSTVEVHQLGSTGNDEGRGIATDGTGRIYLTGETAGRMPGSVEPSAGADDAWVVRLHAASFEVVVGWTAAEQARLVAMLDFYGYDTVEDLAHFGIYVLAFINAIDPQPNPTPVVLGPAGTSSSTSVTWLDDDVSALDVVRQRWELSDADAHRWGFLVLSFIAALSGV